MLDETQKAEIRATTIDPDLKGKIIGQTWYPEGHPCIVCFEKMVGDCQGCSTPKEWTGIKPARIQTFDVLSKYPENERQEVRF